MQIKNSAVLLAALPSVLATLPSTLTLFVQNGGERLGCINGYGKFTRNLLYCLPFRSYVTTDPNSTLKGFEACGVLPDGTFSCYQNGGVQSEFHQLGIDLALAGAQDATFSVDAIPASETDNIGVTVYANADHAVQFKIRVQSTQG